MITLFTRAVQFFLVYELWVIFLFERDKHLIFYFAVAFIKVNRDIILQLGSIEKLLQYFMKDLKIVDFADLARVYCEAVAIRSNTPISFTVLIKKLGLFDTC